MVWADNGAGSAAVRLANDTSASSSSTGVEVKPPVACARCHSSLRRSPPATSRRTTPTSLHEPTNRGATPTSPTTRKHWSNSAGFSDSEMPERWSTTGAASRRRCCRRPRRAPARGRSSERVAHPRRHGRDQRHPRPDRGAIVNDEIDRIERELYLADKRNGVTRTASQRRSAALVEMATRSGTAPADGQRPKPRFTALVGDETMSQLCELANGTVVTPGSIFEYAGDADLETVLFDGPSTVISVSHRRTFTGQLRRAVQVRDRHCQHESGCDVPADQCDIDHIVPHADDGPTSQFNGKAECHPHNRNPERHDHGGVPRPTRPVDRLDEIRCRLRWQMLRADPDGEADDRADPSNPTIRRYRPPPIRSEFARLTSHALTSTPRTTNVAA